MLLVTDSNQGLPLVGRRHVSEAVSHCIVQLHIEEEGGGLFCKGRGLFFIKFLWQYGYHWLWPHMYVLQKCSLSPPLGECRHPVYTHPQVWHAVHKMCV